mgnify:CR=1 FL=1
MARRGIEPMHDEHVNVTPLIDVVMCLIIFFLLVGQLTKDETAGAVHVPVASTGGPIVDQQGGLIVNVMPRPGVTAPSTKDDVQVLMRNRTYTIEEMPRALMTEQADAQAHGRKLELALRADRALPYQCVAPVLVSCAQADIRSVNFAIDR